MGNFNIIIMNTNSEIDPEKVSKWIKLGIAILTAILGFFTGMGTATAAQVLFF